MKFKFAVSNPDDSAFSLKKEDSDFTSNQIVLNAVIGTLVKYGHSGEIEPYLSENWSISSNKKVWIFKFKEGLLTESGECINASSYLEILKKKLKTFSKNSSVVMFDNLIGWYDFISEKSVP